ncbi:MAG TPA: hypothetical protein VFH61_07755, partial [Thermoleophilia bacterium]|nr:hypothetical protein [Thermoleophilia bacterium]
MPAGVFQRSFAGGELSEAISARADVVKRATGARTMFNGFAARTGAWLNRAGTKFVNEVKDSTQVTTSDIETGVPETVISFIFNSENAYILEFGELYVRLHRYGSPVMVGPLSAYAAGTPYEQGELVESGGSDWYAKQDTTGNLPAAGSEFWYELPVTPAWYSGDFTSILEIPTPYAAGEITKQNVAQSADVLSISHKNHSPRELRRLSATQWVLVELAFLPEIASPGGLATIVTFGAGPIVYHYKVTAIRKDTYEESVVGHLDASSVGVIDSGGTTDLVINT